MAVTMRVNVGFGGVQKQSVWTPIAVQLSNPGESDIEGDLRIDLPGSGRTPMPVCTAAVNLPAHSTKLYHVYGRLSGYGGKLRVVLARGYGVLAAKEVNINTASEDDKLIVTVGDRSGRLSFLQGETINVPAKPRRQGPGYSPGGTTTANIEAGSISPEVLPDRPAAYEGIDVLVVSGLVPESTNPNSLKAVCSWVASGGTLVVSAGPDYRAYTNAFYDELLPVSVQGAADVPNMAGLSSIGGQAFPATPAVVTHSTVKPGVGRVLVAGPGMPLAVVRKYGAGRVVFLAFDYRTPPFSDWNGKTAFWKSIIRSAGGEPIVPTNTQFAGEDYYSQYGYRQEEGLGDVVSKNPSVKTPSINTIGFFLLAYLIVLVPVNYVVLRRRRRLELAWLTTPAIVILFTIGAYLIGYTMKGGSLRLCEATIVEASSGARYGRAVTNASLFSPARRSYDMAISDPSAISQMISTGPGDQPPTAYLGDTSLIPGVGMAMWSSKSFESVGGRDLGGAVTATLRQNGGEISGQITNNTAVDLHDCRVVFGSARLDIGRLSKGHSKQIKLAYGGAVGGGPSNSDPEQPLTLRMDRFATRCAMQAGSPALVGYASAGDGTFGVANNRPRAERSLCYIVHLNYEVGDAAVINPGMVKAWRPDEDSYYYDRQGDAQGGGMLGGYVQGGESFTGAYELPVPAGYKVTSLSLVGWVNRNSKAGAGKGRVSVKLLNRKNGKWDEVSFPSGGSVPNPAAYVSEENVVKAKISSTGGAQSEVSCGISAEARRQ